MDANTSGTLTTWDYPLPEGPNERIAKLVAMLTLSWTPASLVDTVIHRVALHNIRAYERATSTTIWADRQKMSYWKTFFDAETHGDIGLAQMNIFALQLGSDAWTCGFGDVKQHKYGWTFDFAITYPRLAHHFGLPTDRRVMRIESMGVGASKPGADLHDRVDIRRQLVDR